VRLELGSGEPSTGTPTRAAVLVLGEARNGEKLSNYAGATREWMFAGARPWGRRCVAGHWSAADRGTDVYMGTTAS
jgi:hypothetical protein